MLLAPPGDRLRLTSAAPEVHALAGRLWAPASRAENGREPIAVDVRVVPGPPDAGDAEDAPVWRSEADGAVWHVALGGEVTVRVDVAAAFVEAAVSARLLGSAPSLASRVVLEAPVALLLSHRGYQPLHAGAVTGPRGAVVLRGPQGAGKSTLVGAAFRAGLGVLGDESVLVARDDADGLAASVRELTLREDAAGLLTLEGRTTPARVGGETKRRVDLFSGASPADRSARRVATVLLGPREPGPARLTPLTGEAFLRAFRLGTIPQEELGEADPDRPARAWAPSGLLLTGAADLAGAVALLTELVR